MSEPSYVYFLIRAEETSPLLQSAPDGEVAAEAIYERHVRERLEYLGVEVLACEMPGWRSDCTILNALRENHLDDESGPEDEIEQVEETVEGWPASAGFAPRTRATR